MYYTSMYYVRTYKENCYLLICTTQLLASLYLLTLLALELVLTQMRRLAFQGCEKGQVKACRNAAGSLGSLTIPTIPCSLLDHKTCMHVGFMKVHILRFWGSQSKMENFNNSNWVLMEKGVLNVYCFYFQLEYFSTQVFYLKIFGFFYQVVYNLIFSFAINDFLKFGSQICVGFRRIEMPPLAIISFVSYVQISSPQNVVTVFINATSMPTCFTIIEDPGKWKIQILKFQMKVVLILLLFFPSSSETVTLI